MTRSFEVRRHCLLTAMVAALAIGQGCGTGEYEKRMEARLWARQGRGGGAAAAKVDVPGMAATFSPPTGMQALDIGANPERGRPPRANLPGLKATYEGFLLDSTMGKQHYYCYLVSADPGADAMGPVLKGLAPTIKGEAKWDTKEVDAQGPDGKPLKLRTASASGKQDFHYIDSQGAPQTSEMDGVVQVWDREIQPGGPHLLVVWRVPAVIAGKQYVNSEERGKAMAAGVAPK